MDRSSSVAVLDDRRLRVARVHPEVIDESPGPEMNRRVDLSSAVVAPGIHTDPDAADPAMGYRYHALARRVNEPLTS